MVLSLFKTSKTVPSVNVLIVDDDAAVRQIILDRMTALGWNVATASDGKEGLAVAAKHKPHIILLDIHMPVMDGLTVLECLRKDPQLSEVSIMMVTGSNHVSDITRAAAFNVADYVTKPFNAVELIRRVQRVLQHAKQAIQSPYAS